MMLVVVRLVVVALILGVPPHAHAQGAPSVGTTGALAAERTAEEVYRAACITCHGEDGKGAPKSVVGFDVALPDFSDCAFATAEPDADWRAVVHEGGPIRGLDRHMPSFGDALSMDDIALAISHVRTFCRNRAWPRGDLNLPRGFFTEKAFPENEIVWTTGVSVSGVVGSPFDRSISNALVYERRFGARNQVELVAPVEFDRGDGGAWNSGIGDLALAIKRTVYASERTGGVGAAGVEITLPTGNERRGLGNGFTVVEPFAAWGQLLPRRSFLQLAGGALLPSDATAGTKEIYLHASVGATFAQARGFGRQWSPQVEVLWARPQRRTAEWDVVPELHVTLSKIQHVALTGGVRIPLNLRYREGRQVQVLVSLVWDWFDGGFFEFWK